MNNSDYTKFITLRHPFEVEGISLAETYKLRKMLQHIMQQGSITCFAQKKGRRIGVYLEDGTLFHSVADGTKLKLLTIALQKEKLLFGEICSHAAISIDKCFHIKLYYDYISGNHDKQEIARLWLRDSFANMRGVSVPKAKYIGNGFRVDKTESSAAHFINDAVDVEMDDEHYGKIEKAIRSTRDGTITKVLNVVATIPQWASQVAYFVVTDDAPLWLAPSFNADVLDMVHQNGIAKGRVVSYHNNYNGTYHFEIKIHVE